MLLDGQENHSHTVASGLRQGEAQLLALASEEFVWNLDQDAGTVAGFRVAAAGSAMRKIQEDLDAFADDVVTFLPEMLATNPIPQASCSCAGW